MNGNSPTNYGRDTLAGRYLTTAQAAARLCVTTKTMERWRKIGFGPTYVRLGRKALYSDHALATWEASRSFNSTAAESRAARLAA